MAYVNGDATRLLDVLGDLLPAVHFLTGRGRIAAARLLVAGNRAAVTTTLHVVRAHQLDDGWFDQVQ